MKKMIVGIVVIAVGVGIGLFILLRKNSVTSVRQEARVAAPTPNAFEELNPAAVNELLLSVLAPVDGATVTTPALTVRGTTAPKAEVFINELEMRADATGNFSGSLTLDEGENFIIVMVNDESGNVAEKDLVVTYVSGQ
ncbi:hypothetical protein HY948_00980 [Candidatus Gottesmanbacteria bacterium]|nr:hypothetical protein [Candidatus Gottesmanbacteria bacterium]